MSELLTENRRLHSQIEKLTDENMNLAAVIRTLRQHLREDNAKLEDAYRNARADEAIRERNEAQENLRILAGLVAYGLGQSGEEWSLEAMRQATAAIQKAKALEGEK